MEIAVKNVGEMFTQGVLKRTPTSSFESDRLWDIRGTIKTTRWRNGCMSLFYAEARDFEVVQVIKTTQSITCFIQEGGWTVQFEDNLGVKKINFESLTIEEQYQYLILFNVVRRESKKSSY